MRRGQPQLLAYIMPSIIFLRDYVYFLKETHAKYEQKHMKTQYQQRINAIEDKGSM